MKNKKLMLFAFVITGLLVFSSCEATTTTDTDDDMIPSEEMATESDEITDETEEMDAVEESQDTDIETEEMMNDNVLLLHTLDGEEVNVLSGEKVYVKTWASWCSICLSGLGELDELSARDNGFKVISVVAPSVMGEINEADFIYWWNSLEYENIVVLLDRGGDFFSDVGVRAFPTSVYIDSNGELVTTKIGHNSNQLIMDTMKDIT